MQAADTLSPILQNICELSYPLNPDVLLVLELFTSSMMYF